MSAPTAPTLTSLTTEALKMSGYSSPSAAQLTIAADFVEQIKNDIWMRCKTLKSLQSTAVMVTTNGQSRYSYPTDYSSDMTMTVMDGANSGIAQAGASGSVTLASSANFVESDLLGKEILIYSGTGKGSLSQITAYNNTTKVATVTPNFTTAPAASDGYLIIDTYYPVHQEPVFNFDKLTLQTIRDMPTHYSPIGDADYGEFILYPSPYRTSGIPWGIKQRYYADLLTLDLAGTLMATLYKRWRNVFIQGVFAKQLQKDDDNRASGELQAYYQQLNNLLMREQYGLDLSNLQCTVSDY